MIAAFERFLNEEVLAHHFELVDVGLSTSAKTPRENDALGYIIYDTNKIVPEQPTKMDVEFRRESESWVNTMAWVDQKAREKGNRYFKHDISLRQGDDNDYQVAAIYYWKNLIQKPLTIKVDFVRDKNWDGTFKALKNKWDEKYA